MAVTTQLIRELRERTGAGMMECKKQLVACDGDLEAAIDALRKSGQAKAAKKAGRVTAEGLVAVRVETNKAWMAEVNCETDFVARDDHFKAFVQKVLDTAASSAGKDTAALQEMLEPARVELFQKIRENINIRRTACLEGDVLGSYVHSNQRVAAIVALKGGNPELAHDLAMHVVAQTPMVCRKEDMPQDALEREASVLRAQAEESGKPPAVVEKMVAGRLKNFLKESVLLEQVFIKPEQGTIEQMLKESGAEVLGFVRYTVGEGIEKKEVDFAAEVHAAAGV